MTGENSQSKVRLSIALPDKPRGLYDEFGAMLLDTLSDTRFQAALVSDGDPSAQESDILLMIGDCLCFEGYADLMSHNPKHRPVTAFWLLDTLPPTALDTRSAKAASRLQHYDQGLYWMRTHLKPVISVIPLSLRRKLGLKACSTLMQGLDSGDANLHPALEELDANSRYEIFGRYAWFRENMPKGWLDHVIVNTAPKGEFLSTMGIQSERVPMGYHPILGTDMNTKRDIDVLMVGEVAYGRRRDIVEAVERRLVPMGIGVTVVKGSCYGQERTDLFNRAKISLNIPRFQWDIPTIRFFISMACGTLAVSEEMGSTWPFENGKHMVQASAKELPDLIAYYLEHNDERMEITRAAHDLITSELTLKNAILRTLAACIAS